MPLRLPEEKIRFDVCPITKGGEEALVFMIKEYYYRQN
jgi:hypothetical protein